MRFTPIFLLACTAAISLAACDGGATGNNAATAEAEEGVSDKSLAQDLSGDDSKFAEAVKSVGLDRTLDGPGPYTVLLPSNAAFDKLPANGFDNLLKPEARAETTELLTFHVLPGTILAADIGKAIDTGGGKATLMTMQGGTITATREGDKIVLTDSAGGKATVAATDDKRKNGVIHRIDTVLSPARPA